MKKTLLPIVLLFSSLLINAQTESTGFGISFSGFVKTDFFLDTRQTANIREGHFLLYPLPEKLDASGEDVNKEASFNILSIQSRLHGKITGPDAFGAKTSGVIEAEFFGTSDADVNGFRLRHAFVKIDWPGISLLAGQTWHPMFITEMFPGVVSFNTGVPFQPFSRNPQVRVSVNSGDLKFIAAAAAQRDFTSDGPDKGSSSYLRNAVVPNLNGQFQLSAGGNLFGAGVDFKMIQPRITTAKNTKTDEKAAGLSFFGYTKLDLNPVTLKLQGIVGENLSDLLMLGGYAVKSIDTTTGVETYTPLGSYSVWGDVSIGKEIEFGIFAGYTKNRGAKDNISGTYYGRGTNIDNVMRISPRVQFNSGKTRIAAEVEYTSAGYGTPDNADKGKVKNITNVNNTRLLVAVFYFF